jgi:hypothetical protein
VEVWILSGGGIVVMFLVSLTLQVNRVYILFFFFSSQICVRYFPDWESDILVRLRNV